MSEQLIERVDEQNNKQIYERQCVHELEQWLETEAKFYGRTDFDFLLMFLRGCKFNMEKVKKKMFKYYENRKKIPQWCSNRNIEDLEHITQKKIGVLIKDSDPCLPLLVMVQYARYGPQSNLFDDIMKWLSILTDLAIRRASCQSNGLILVYDCRELPLWLITKYFNPVVVSNTIQAIYSAIPVRLVSVHFLNFPWMGRAAWQMAKPILSVKLRQRFNFYGSDWSTLKEKIDPNLLPEEYGGVNGPLSDHEEAFIEEFYQFADYLKDDVKYGLRERT